MALKLKNKDLNNVAYIRVLQFSVNKAVGYRVHVNENSGASGFTYSELRSDEKIKEIDEKWLKDILPDVCHVYKDNLLVTDGDISYEDEFKFVVKADEFMRFVALVGHEKTALNVRYALFTLLATVIAVIVAVTTLGVQPP